MYVRVCVCMYVCMHMVLLFLKRFGGREYFKFYSKRVYENKKEKEYERTGLDLEIAKKFAVTIRFLFTRRMINVSVNL